MLGIVIPANNEQDLIEACLAACAQAARHEGLRGEPVQPVVVLDNCSDATDMRARLAGADTISVSACNVGAARAAGAEWLLERGARWLAFTDADSRVAPDWLTAQLALDADAVCGTITVDDWTPHGDSADWLRRHFLRTYRDEDGHRHIHGANLGVSALAYRRAGGFQPLASSEDVALVNALMDAGLRVAWSARPRVTTSARRIARAPLGFADALNQALAQGLPGPGTAPVAS